MELCECGCGKPVLSAVARRLPECKRRLMVERRRLTRTQTRSTGRRALVHSRATGEVRAPRLVCKVCFDLSERRGRTCYGCGLPWAPERRSA